MMPLPTGGYTDFSYGGPMGMPPSVFGREATQEEMEASYREQAVAMLTSQHVHNLVHSVTLSVLRRLQRGANDYTGEENDARIAASGLNTLTLDGGAKISVSVVVSLDHIDLTPPRITYKEAGAE